MSPSRETKVAIVHDFLLAFGGAERVLRSLAEMYPEAPIYTLLADKRIVKKYFPKSEIRESLLGSFPKFLKKRHRLLLPFYPASVEAFDLREFDLVISSSGAWSKGVVTRLHTRHVAYVHSPMRYVWDENESYLRALRLFFPFRFFGRAILSYLRIWDKQAAERPDVLIANSEYTRRRIEKYYRLPSEVIYPPASLCEAFRAGPPVALPSEGLEFEKKDYFLMVSRLTEAKKVGIAIEAFNKLELPLVIVGEGPMRKSLQKIAGKNIKFLGFQKDEHMSKLYGEARSLVHVAEEDFGLAMAEAFSHGTQVIAFDRGGSRELVRSGINGELFFAQTPEILSDGVRRFIANEGKYDREQMRQGTLRFSKEEFQKEIRKIVKKVII